MFVKAKVSFCGSSNTNLALTGFSCKISPNRNIPTPQMEYLASASILLTLGQVGRAYQIFTMETSSITIIKNNHNRLCT